MVNKYLKQIISGDYLGFNAGSISSGNEDQKPSSEDGLYLLIQVRYCFIYASDTIYYQGVK